MNARAISLIIFVLSLTVPSHGRANDCQFEHDHQTIQQIAEEQGPGEVFLSGVTITFQELSSLIGQALSSRFQTDYALDIVLNNICVDVGSGDPSLIVRRGPDGDPSLIIRQGRNFEKSRIVFKNVHFSKKVDISIGQCGLTRISNLTNVGRLTICPYKGHNFSIGRNESEKTPSSIDELIVTACSDIDEFDLGVTKLKKLTVSNCSGKTFSTPIFADVSLLNLNFLEYNIGFNQIDMKRNDVEFSLFIDSTLSADFGDCAFHMKIVSDFFQYNKNKQWEQWPTQEGASFDKVSSHLNEEGLACPISLELLGDFDNVSLYNSRIITLHLNSYAIDNVSVVDSEFLSGGDGLVMRSHKVKFLTLANNSYDDDFEFRIEPKKNVVQTWISAPDVQLDKIFARTRFYFADRVLPNFNVLKGDYDAIIGFAAAVDRYIQNLDISFPRKGQSRCALNTWRALGPDRVLGKGCDPFVEEF